jgi:hypothetical protein
MKLKRRKALYICGVTKVVKQFRRKFLFVTVFVSVLLSYTVFTSPIPCVHATETDIESEMMTILSDVIGLNTEEYLVQITLNPDGNYRGLPQKDAEATLSSAQDTIRVRYYFVNDDNPRMIYVAYSDFLTEYPDASITAEMAKTFLQRYQNYTGDSFYGELASMLDDLDVTQNVTESSGNIMLEVNNLDQIIVDYIWTYADENGTVAKSKNVLLSYERGRLNVFLNNWPLYTVMATPEISGEEATEIAIEASQSYSYDVNADNGTMTVTGFEIAPESLGYEVLSYLNSPDPSLARGGDPFALYPSWYVPIGFATSYPGGVTGLKVTVWADTGEVSSINPMVVAFIPEFLSWGIISVLFIAVFVAVIYTRKLPEH